MAVVYSFGWFCCLMSGFYVLRPIREALGSALGSGELKRLFLATFLVTLVTVPAFSRLVTMVPRRILIHVVFHFLVSHVLVFALLVGQFGTQNNPILARVYFVWVTVFGLFAVSVFWSVLADLFTDAQGKRLFGPIASGGTTGALVGSLLASNLPRMIGLAWLLCISAVLIELGLVFASLLDAAKAAIESDEARTVFFGNINLAVQIGTLVCQTLVVGPTGNFSKESSAGQRINDVFFRLTRPAMQSAKQRHDS